MRYGTRSARRAAFLTALALALTSIAATVGEPTLDAIVEHISGTELRLSVGSGQGIAPGDLLQVFTDASDQLLGRLRVISVSDEGAIATFAGDPFPLTRGTPLQLAVINSREEPPELPASASRTRAAAPATSALPPESGGMSPRVDGSLGLQFNARETITEWEDSGVERVERTFTTPTAALRLRVVDLPGGVTFRTSLRGSYRSSTNDLVQPKDFVRVYSLQVDKSFRNLQLGLGRLYNTYEPLTGYYDGAYVHYGRDGFGGGVAAGLQPDRENGGVTTDLPKYSLFANYSDRNGALRYEGVVSFSQVLPASSTGLEDHTYFGWTQTLRAGRLAVRHSMQVDRDVGNDKWVASRFLLSASAPLGSWLGIHARYSLRQPYELEAVGDVVSYRRDRANVGLTLNAGSALLGADFTVNDVRDDGIDSGYTYSGHFSIPNTSLAGLGLTGSVSYWDRERDDVLYASPGLTRAFGRTRTRAAYHYYRTDEGGLAVSTHAADLSVDFPISRRLRGTLTGRLQRGEALDGNSIYAALWWAF
jgi:hypothetical protein